MLWPFILEHKEEVCSQSFQHQKWQAWAHAAGCFLLPSLFWLTSYSLHWFRLWMKRFQTLLKKEGWKARWIHLALRLSYYHAANQHFIPVKTLQWLQKILRMPCCLFCEENLETKFHKTRRKLLFHWKWRQVIIKSKDLILGWCFK